MTKAWIWLYVIGSILLFAVYAVGLSGWFFEYPIGLMIALFTVFTAPIVMAACGLPSAPNWNIAIQWTLLTLVALRSVNLFIGPGSVDELQTSDLAAVAVIITVGFAWALAWTIYFRAG